MSDQPVTSYIKSGDTYVAYQVFGEGPDLVFVPGWISHLEVMWEIPPLAKFLRRLSSFVRLIVIDKRGTGLSDPLPPDQAPLLEERMEDVRAVMDAVGSERAALLGISEGGPMTMLFAATYPDRTSALVLYATYAKTLRGADHPFGASREQAEQFLQILETRWGDGIGLAALAPSFADDERMIELWARYQRMSCAPGAAASLLRLAGDIDMREVLPAVGAPTLVLHRSGDRFVVREQGVYLAERIAGAKLVEFDENDHLYFAGDIDALLGEVEEFLTGERGSARADEDRVLATVVFTDIVGSTAHAAKLGDQAWRELLDRHDAMVARQLERFNGRSVKTTGDGVLATFDGPARAVHCAAAIIEGARKIGLEARAGVHTGECVVRGDDVAGIAVHIGARVAKLAGAGEVMVSSTVRDLVAGSGLAFDERGEHELKGVPGTWRILVARI